MSSTASSTSRMMRPRWNLPLAPADPGSATYALRRRPESILPMPTMRGPLFKPAAGPVRPHRGQNAPDGAVQNAAHGRPTVPNSAHFASPRRPPVPNLATFILYARIAIP